MVDGDEPIEDGPHLAGPTSLGLRQERIERLGAGHRPRLTAQRPRPHALGPGVQRCVGWNPIAVQQGPGHAPQTPVAACIGGALELDHRQSVGLVRQHIARQQPPAALARHTTHHRHEDDDLDRLPLAVGVLAECDQATLDHGPAQDQRRRPFARAEFSLLKLEMAFPTESVVGTVGGTNRDRHGAFMSMAVERRLVPSLHTFVHRCGPVTLHQSRW